MKNVEWKTFDYKEFLLNLDELYYKIKGQMGDRGIVPLSKEFKQEVKDREKFKMNQTFNMTASMHDGVTTANVTPMPLLNQTGMTFNGKPDQQDESVYVQDQRE